jgi:mono/diheme cytochrome c family protein
MTDVVHLSSAALRRAQFAAPLERSLYRATIANGTRRALDELPDNVLNDIGLARADLPFIAGELAFEGNDAARKARGAPARQLPSRVLVSLAAAAVAAVLTFAVLSRAVLAQDSQTGRGKYLVALAGCNDCHTPGYFFGKPDMTRFLGGSEVGFEIPDRGVFHSPNLTPDQETGLGKWSAGEIVTAITTGQRPDGRILAPIMPWHAFANLTPQDARAIAAYLKSLPPVKNQVPGPFGPNEKPTSFVMKIVPP